MQTATAFSGTSGKVKVDGPNNRVQFSSDSPAAWGNATSTASGSIDVRLKRSTANTLTIDNGASPTPSKAHLVPGNLYCDSLRPKSVFKDTGYTLQSETTVFGDAASGDITISLPGSPATDQTVVVKKIDASSNLVTVSGSINNIDGAGTYDLTTQYQFVVLQWDAFSGEWRIIGRG